MESMENKVRHLEMIQGIVNRLAGNSFSFKGWSVILISALFALAAADSTKLFILLAYLPALAFWGLDGYYLRQERLFRALYDRVRVMEEGDIDFSMSTAPVVEQVAPWWSVVRSNTIRNFHGAIFITITIVFILAVLF